MILKKWHQQAWVEFDQFDRIFEAVPGFLSKDHALKKFQPSWSFKLGNFTCGKKAKGTFEGLCYFGTKAKAPAPTRLTCSLSQISEPWVGLVVV